MVTRQPSSQIQSSGYKRPGSLLTISSLEARFGPISCYPILELPSAALVNKPEFIKPETEYLGTLFRVVYMYIG